MKEMSSEKLEIVFGLFVDFFLNKIFINFFLFFLFIYIYINLHKKIIFYKDLTKLKSLLKC